MSNTMIKPGTPLDRVRRQRGVKPNRASNRMTAREQERLRIILDESFDFVDDPIFHRANAQRKVFDEAPVIPAPNTSWYHPVMEDLGKARQEKSVVNVVLKTDQERALFLQFNYARFRAAKVRKAIGTNEFSPEQGRDLLHWHDLAGKLRDQVARSNLALVLAMAKRVRHSELDFGDLISEGNMALLRAVDKFNVSRGFKFSTYACRAILKAFSRSGMKQSQYRNLFPTDFDPALERSDHQLRRVQSHEYDCASEVRRIVAQNVAELTDVEQAVINHRFAIHRAGEPDPPSLTLEQVGQIVGLTKERVRQIQNKALEKIRRTLEVGFLDGTPLDVEASATLKAQQAVKVG